MNVQRLSLVLIVALVLMACVPAIIGVSFAAGGMTVGATYEILDDDDDKPPQDAGVDR